MGPTRVDLRNQIYVLWFWDQKTSRWDSKHPTKPENFMINISTVSLVTVVCYEREIMEIYVTVLTLEATAFQLTVLFELQGFGDPLTL